LSKPEVVIRDGVRQSVGVVWLIVCRYLRTTEFGWLSVGTQGQGLGWQLLVLMMGMFVDMLQGVGQCSVAPGQLKVDPGLEVVHQVMLSCRWLVASQQIFVTGRYSSRSGSRGSEQSWWRQSSYGV
jgi:hypothetical protein